MKINLITFFDVIYTGRKNGQKLQCLYGNPMKKLNFTQFVNQNVKIPGRRPPNMPN